MALKPKEVIEDVDVTDAASCERMATRGGRDAGHRRQQRGILLRTRGKGDGWVDGVRRGVEDD